MLKYTTVMKPGVNRQTFAEWLRFTWWRLFQKQREPSTEFIPNPIVWVNKKTR